MEEYISIDELKELYVNQGFSATYISKLKGCSDKSIRKRLKMNNIQIRNFSEQYKIDKKYSRSREYIGLKGKDNPSYVHGNKIGQKENRAKYLKIAKEHLKWECEICKCKPKPKFDLCVHHKDRNNKNNELSNLMILCSECHGRIHSKDNKKHTKLICQSCGTEFIGFNLQKFCSKKCSGKEYRIKNREKINNQQILSRLERIPIKIKVCPECLNKFETRDTRKIFCSNKCYDKYELYIKKQEYRIKQRGIY